PPEGVEGASAVGADMEGSQESAYFFVRDRLVGAGTRDLHDDDVRAGLGAHLEQDALARRVAALARAALLHETQPAHLASLHVHGGFDRLLALAHSHAAETRI